MLVNEVPLPKQLAMTIGYSYVRGARQCAREFH